MSENKLHRVTVKLNADGIQEIINVWDIVKEGDKTYTIERKDKWEETIKKMLKKEKINIIDEGVWMNCISLIAYSAWCFESEIPKFIDLCKERVITTAKNYEAAFNKVLAHL